MKENRPVLELCNISKSYKQGEENLIVLSETSLSIYRGEIVAIVGQSGSGKSTLLHIAGLLDKSNSGNVLINAVDCTKASDKYRTKLRAKYMGFVYQFHHLLPEFTALENVIIPQLINYSEEYGIAEEKAYYILGRMGLADRLKHLPNQLSGGEQQRVAIARALVSSPMLFYADEPTGNLDPDTADIVLDLMLEILRELQSSALIVTHNFDIASRMDKIVKIGKGKLCLFS